MTDFVTFARRGIYLGYKTEKMSLPQVPWTIDVLYFMKLTEQQQFYTLGLHCSPTYISNLAMIAHIVAVDVLCMKPYDEREAHKIIAQAIIEMYPLAARCLLKPHYIRTLKIAETIRYSQEILQSTDEAVLENACTCSLCYTNN